MVKCVCVFMGVTRSCRYHCNHSELVIEDDFTRCEVEWC
jgi:hypothetical protein